MNNFKYIGMVIFGLLLMASSCSSNKDMGQSDNEQKGKDKTEKKKTVEVNKKVVVEPGYMPATTDGYSILESRISGDELIVLVQYGGGCEDHGWELKTNGAYAKSLPPQITLNLEHNSNNDMCRALVRDTLEFNIKEIQYPGSSPLKVKMFNFDENTLLYRY